MFQFSFNNYLIIYTKSLFGERHRHSLCKCVLTCLTRQQYLSSQGQWSQLLHIGSALKGRGVFHIVQGVAHTHLIQKHDHTHRIPKDGECSSKLQIQPHQHRPSRGNYLRMLFTF